MKEEWLLDNAAVPVTCETVTALVAEIKRLIDVVGGMALAQQEPVLWEMPDGKTADKWALQFYGGQKGKPLYTTPPAALAEHPAQPEFPTHEEGDDGWSDWVCPDPKGYLMKCCDCGLVHEAQFGVVRYKSETEREDCDVVDDPNLQTVFRMRRSEQWTPKDTAYRPGGMAQPEQEPVAWAYPEGLEALKSGKPWVVYGRDGVDRIPLYLASRQWQGLTDEDVDEVERWVAFKEDGSGRIPTQKLVRYIERKLKERNT